MEPFYALSASDRVELTREARRNGQPLMARWASIEPDFGNRWEPRAAQAAEWLGGAASVADLGCGTMNLERYLRADQAYVPVDVVARDERTLVLDLNVTSDLARLPAADACALLGVLEYCYALEDAVEAIGATYAQVVSSFNVAFEGQSHDARLEHGWVNDCTRDEIVDLFGRHGFAAASAARLRRPPARASLRLPARRCALTRRSARRTFNASATSATP